jgi:hypothetical protein
MDAPAPVNLSQESEARRLEASNFWSFVLFWLLFASLGTCTGLFGVINMMRFNSYEMYERHGTVVAAWSTQKEKGDNPFMIMETVSYHIAGVERNCTLEGRSFYSQRVADLVATELVIGEDRHMHVPKYVTELACLNYDDWVEYIAIGLLLFYLTALILLFVGCTAYEYVVKRPPAVATGNATPFIVGTGMATAPWVSYAPVRTVDAHNSIVRRRACRYGEVGYTGMMM